ncbi:hypothetical protein BHM03_00010103 [Ensete ventricosum]|nr:hypothetical protein BHM03_00010103 [Ensete ventricosum]
MGFVIRNLDDIGGDGGGRANRDLVEAKEKEGREGKEDGERHGEEVNEDPTPLPKWEDDGLFLGRPGGDGILFHGSPARRTGMAGVSVCSPLSASSLVWSLS